MLSFDSQSVIGLKFALDMFLRQTVATIATMDLNLLALFVEVAKTASFTAAGARLGLPRSSVSRSIAQLEVDLGVPLFNRTTRKVSLSTAGAALFERVGPQLQELRKALGSLPEREEEPSGVLLITAPTDIGVAFLPDAIAAFRLRYPAVTIDARLTPRRVDLVAEGFDLALRVSVKPLSDLSLLVRKLSELEMALYAAPSYLCGAETFAVRKTPRIMNGFTFRRRRRCRRFPN